MNEIDDKESRLNKVFWLLSCVIVLGFFRFINFAVSLVLVECLLVAIRFFIARDLHAQRRALSRAGEIQSAIDMNAAEAAARKRYESERKEAIAQQKKPVAPQSLNLDKSNDAQNTPARIEQIPNDFGSSGDGYFNDAAGLDLTSQYLASGKFDEYVEIQMEFAREYESDDSGDFSPDRQAEQLAWQRENEMGLSGMGDTWDDSL